MFKVLKLLLLLTKKLTNLSLILLTVLLNGGLGAAHSATHCTVYARLKVNGKDYGVKTFVVPLRDSNHDLMPGVTVILVPSKERSDIVSNLVEQMEKDPVLTEFQDILKMNSQINKHKDYLFLVFSILKFSLELVSIWVYLFLVFVVVVPTPNFSTGLLTKVLINSVVSMVVSV